MLQKLLQNYKAAEGTREFIGKKLSPMNSRNVEEIVISPEKREEVLNELRRVL